MGPDRGSANSARRGLLVLAAVFSAALGYATAQVTRGSSPSDGSSGASSQVVIDQAKGISSPLYTWSACGAAQSAEVAGELAAPLATFSTQVASGAVGGRSWSLWASTAASGPSAIEQGGLVLSGRWYGICPGPPDPVDLSMIDSAPAGIVYGYITNLAGASVRLSAPGEALPPPVVEAVNGGTFFVEQLPQSACAYASLDLTATAPAGGDQRHVNFGECGLNALVPETNSYAGS